jgi:hypothetical protein
MTTIKQTALHLSNGTDQDVQVWITLGLTPGCIQNVADLPWGITKINNLQGWFILPKQFSAWYTPKPGVGFNGNLTFASPPLNCPNDSFPYGVNVAEFILNNSFQPGIPQETIEISAVAGVNAFIQFSMTGGGKWNAGSNYPNVTEFANKGLYENVGQVGVYPYGCDVCTQSQAPPYCPGPPTPPPYGGCQSEPICNVQRDASTAGGTVTITFMGWTPPPSQPA